MSEPVGHPAPEPSFERLSHAVTEVISNARGGKITSKNCVHHFGCVIVEANAFRPDDSVPVFADGKPTTAEECCAVLENEVDPKAAVAAAPEGFNPFVIIQTILMLWEIFNGGGEST